MFRLTRPTSPPLDNGVSSSNTDVGTCRQQALTKSSRHLARHHPNVKVPPRLEDKPKDEQIRRCCDRFKSHPLAVDTLIRALSTIVNHPLERRYRSIDQTNPGYQRSLAKAPGAEQLLVALGFVQADATHLFMARVDSDLLVLALSILEQTKQTPEYQQEKKQLLFTKEVSGKVQATPNSEELAYQRELLSLLPREASPGRSAVMMIHLGDTKSTTLTRRFDGDDTLGDVLNWLGGTVGTDFLDKLCTSRQWSLVDVNRQGQIPIDCLGNSQKTLQYLGFWPSGRLALRASSDEWIKERDVKAQLGDSRGLASAPSDFLQF